MPNRVSARPTITPANVRKGIVPHRLSNHNPSPRGTTVARTMNHVNRQAYSQSHIQRIFAPRGHSRATVRAGL